MKTKFDVEVEEYFNHLKEHGDNGIDYIKELSKAYNELLKKLFVRKSTLIVLIFTFILTQLNTVETITLLGIRFKYDGILNSLFLMFYSYYFYQLTSMSMLKNHMMKLYTALAKKNRSPEYRFNFHLFLLPADAEIFEEIYQKKNGKKNLISNFISITIISVIILFNLFLFLFTLQKLSKLTEINFAITLISVLFSIITFVGILINLKNYDEVLKKKELIPKKK